MKWTDRNESEFFLCLPLVPLLIDFTYLFILMVYADHFTSCR